jgi:heat shock protein 5
VKLEQKKMVSWDQKARLVAMPQVISTSGDTHLGGEDFDHRVMDYFIKLIKKKHKVDISKDNRALQKLRREAERAKRALSSQHQV